MERLDRDHLFNYNPTYFFDFWDLENINMKAYRDTTYSIKIRLVFAFYGSRYCNLQ